MAKKKPKKESLSDRVAVLEIEGDVLSERLNDTNFFLRKIELQHQCKHQYIDIPIEVKDGWIAGDAKCRHCGLTFSRKHYEYVRRTAMRRIRRAYEL